MWFFSTLFFATACAPSQSDVSLLPSLDSPEVSLFQEGFEEDTEEFYPGEIVFDDAVYEEEVE